MYKNVTYPVRELFERVWSTLSCSWRGRSAFRMFALSKACRKAGISLPRRGHWAKPEEKRLKRPEPPDSTESITFRVLDRSVFPPAPSRKAASSKPSKLNMPIKLTDRTHLFASGLRL